MDLNIIKIASDTSNNKVIKHYGDIAKQKNTLCGDHIEIKLNIYENYSKKLTSRYESYDYSIYEDSEKIYLDLICLMGIIEKMLKIYLKII